MGTLPDQHTGDICWQEDDGEDDVTADIPPLLRSLHQSAQTQLVDSESQGDEAVEEGGGEGSQHDGEDDGEEDAGQSKPWPGGLTYRAGDINFLIITVQWQSILPTKNPTKSNRAD